MTSFPNSIIRCYAFFGLLDSKSQKIADILDSHVNDNEKINIQSGCTLLDGTVNSFMANESYYHSQKRTKNKVRLIDKRRIKKHEMKYPRATLIWENKTRNYKS